MVFHSVAQVMKSSGRPGSDLDSHHEKLRPWIMYNGRGVADARFRAQAGRMFSILIINSVALALPDVRY